MKAPPEVRFMLITATVLELMLFRMDISSLGSCLSLY